MASVAPRCMSMTTIQRTLNDQLMDNLEFTNGAHDDSTTINTENGYDGDGESGGKEDYSARRNIGIKHCRGAATGWGSDLSTTYDHDDYLGYIDYGSDNDSDLSTTSDTDDCADYDSDDDRCTYCDEVFEEESDIASYIGHHYHRECLEERLSF